MIPTLVPGLDHVLDGGLPRGKLVQFRADREVWRPLSDRLRTLLPGPAWHTEHLKDLNLEDFVPSALGTMYAEQNGAALELNMFDALGVSTLAVAARITESCAVMFSRHDITSAVVSRNVVVVHLRLDEGHLFADVTEPRGAERSAQIVLPTP